MSDDEFQEIKEGVETILTQRYNNIDEETAVELNEILQRHYIFNRKIKDAELIQSISINEIIDLYRENLLGNDNQLEVHVISESHKQKYSESKTNTASVIEDVNEFKQKVEIYEGCYHPSKQQSH